MLCMFEKTKMTSLFACTAVLICILSHTDDYIQGGKSHAIIDEISAHAHNKSITRLMQRTRSFLYKFYSMTFRYAVSMLLC